jgi:hypothetical protein
MGAASVEGVGEARPRRAFAGVRWRPGHLGSFSDLSPGPEPVAEGMATVGESRVPRLARLQHAGRDWQTQHQQPWMGRKKHSSRPLGALSEGKLP